MRQVFLNEEHRLEYERLQRKDFFSLQPDLYPKVRAEMRDGSRILDIGCGSGEFLRFLEPMERVGLDLAISGLKKTRIQSPLSKLVQAEAEALPFRGESFDHIACLGSLEHFRDMGQALKEMARILNRDGYACILVPNSKFIGRPIYELRWRFAPRCSQPIERLGSLDEWKKILKDNGFQIIKVEKYNGVHLPFPFNLIFNYLIRPFLPLRYSYHFLFVLRPNIF
jgi:ubiquinone/menaquinone biosynthesis C-methylase UbiE